MCTRPDTTGSPGSMVRCSGAGWATLGQHHGRKRPSIPNLSQRGIRPLTCGFTAFRRRQKTPRSPSHGGSAGSNPVGGTNAAGPVKARKRWSRACCVCTPIRALTRAESVESFRRSEAGEGRLRRLGGLPGKDCADSAAFPGKTAPTRRPSRERLRRLGGLPGEDCADSAAFPGKTAPTRRPSRGRLRRLGVAAIRAAPAAAARPTRRRRWRSRARWWQIRTGRCAPPLLLRPGSPPSSP